ncbi:cytochrome c nitrite reductase small subunit [Actinomycetaceae bacterium WB03_NA08]|uniref:Cytochrome c nitrite reductase small subunit n=1 Tax=Scrofimicrobium canadense TaxID=2652290 RepID=A0A6N7W756_9ACTO|nr:cytochrome c nitrite reductase small subunit [Scrofimicrobium canadense]MSS84076.1 cytochrome c nitrite reductase small subunit [Scrofimicrobium canadense]
MEAGAQTQRWSLRHVLWGIGAVMTGLVLGLGLFTFVYAKGFSYLSGDPAACINCHVMNEEYDGWLHGPHANVATCNDCHLPHDNVVAKYYTKAENGFVHASKFTLGNYPENIVIRDVSLQITNDACIYCHADFVDDVTHPGNYADEEFSCVRCHSGIGH